MIICFENCFLQDVTILFDLSFSRFRLTQSTFFQLTRDWGSNLGRLKKFHQKIFNDSFAQNFRKIVATLRDKIFSVMFVLLMRNEKFLDLCSIAIFLKGASRTSLAWLPTRVTVVAYASKDRMWAISLL